MNTHLPAAVLFLLAFVLYALGLAGGGVLAAGIGFILEAKAWSQVIAGASSRKAARAKVR